MLTSAYGTASQELSLYQQTLKQVEATTARYSTAAYMPVERQVRKHDGTVSERNAETGNEGDRWVRKGYNNDECDRNRT